MERNKARRQLAAILSADAVGYSRRMADDEAATVQALRAHRETIGGFVREHRGRVNNAVGDNLLAEFASAVDAVTCALDVQTELARREAGLPEERRLRFRIGIHLGDLLVEGDQIYGDGINVAARLEALADPGGICASAAVVEQVRGKVQGAFEDLGDQQLKNIPAPVRVYRVRPLASSPDDAITSLTTVPGFSGRPVIAILPFENRGTDPAQEYLADGIVEDLIARLSAFRLFPVISRSSTFTYKGKRVDARQVSRELRAHYVVEGSVQGAAGRVRVTVQLVDGIEGHQIYSERYDRELGDVFALQDDIVLAIVGSIEPALGRAERQRARLKPTPHLDAWECFQRGPWLLFGLHSKDEIDQALEFFRRACQLDPAFSTAAALQTVGHAALLTYQWSDDPERSVAAALAAAESSLALDNEDPWAHTALGYACSFAGDLPRAIAAFERAIEINPSLTLAYQGLAVVLSAEHPDDAIRVMEKAIRLSPRDLQMHLFRHQLAVAHLIAGRYDDAVKHEEESLRLRADQPHVYRVLAAAYGHLGRSAEALDALEKMRRVAPQFSVETFRRSNSQALVDRCLEGWRRAGWNAW
ncbi:MAG: adenylate/guanylate cyclase domain-containing protein [Deltaproteobacteria bacterium]|nr:adenylate/guanylate cyclase domain-containing protein [Deltaproteobacteria bacterium]